MNRRQFVFSGAAASSIVAIAPLSMAVFDAKAGALDRIDLYKVVYDRRYAASRTFGAAAHRAGATVAPIEGDVTQLWYSDLGPRWAAGARPAAIAGMTSPETLLCLEQMAKDHWLKVVVRAEHAVASGHRVTAAHPALAPTCRVLSGIDWPTQLAHQLIACPADRSGGAVAHVVSGVADAGPDVPLVSWIISA